jgi:hypothetical protein
MKRQSRRWKKSASILRAAQKKAWFSGRGSGAGSPETKMTLSPITFRHLAADSSSRMTPYHAATSPHMRFLILSRASSIRVYFPPWPDAEDLRVAGGCPLSGGHRLPIFKFRRLPVQEG